VNVRLGSEFNFIRMVSVLCSCEHSKEVSGFIKAGIIVSN
jgi:hypothetical protein